MPRTAVDRLMERASGALEAMRYFEAERLCARALEGAALERDFERAARILLPLQEARRQTRQLAVDGDTVHLTGARRARPLPGCWLFQPPLVAADARGFRQRCARAGAAAFVLTREPVTREGLWPLAAYTPGFADGAARTVRCKVAAPREPITVSWFECAAEALGDAAIAGVPAGLHPAWRVADLLACLDACPDHEKLHQRLAEACREAAVAGPPPRRRPSPLVDDPFRF